LNFKYVFGFFQRVEDLNKHPEFGNYLVFILSTMKNDGKSAMSSECFCNFCFYCAADEATRSLGGLILKNSVRQSWEMYPLPNRDYIKQQCLRGMDDSSELIRSTLGYIISTIAMREGLHAWPELLPMLVHMLSQSDYNQLEVRCGCAMCAHRTFVGCFQYIAQIVRRSSIDDGRGHCSTATRYAHT
jgi:hypothetical protein